MDWKNKLYSGDNLDILRSEVPDASVDLMYLDPLFNSSPTCSVPFRQEVAQDPHSGPAALRLSSAAQFMAFQDTWQRGLESETVYKEIVTSGPGKPAKPTNAIYSRMILG
jgi:site-specific DNA-methyltransferase (adenine-specific)